MTVDPITALLDVITDAQLDGNLHPQTNHQRDRLARAKTLARQIRDTHTAAGPTPRQAEAAHALARHASYDPADGARRIAQALTDTAQTAAADTLVDIARALTGHREDTGQRYPLDSTALYKLAEQYRTGQRRPGDGIMDWPAGGRS